MLWVKALHIISVICWFAVLFYLPRLFVYHAQTDDQIGIDRFKIMERKLLRGIGHPSMVATLIFGAWTATYAWSYYASSTWFWLKLALVAILVAYHYMCMYHYRQFLNDRNSKSHVYFRWFNEFPVVLLIAIVILVVVKRP